MKKWIPNVFYAFEYDQLSHYLENQAQRGWILESVGLGVLRFRKAAPQELRYCVDVPSVRRKKGGSTEYLDAYYQMCEEAGWNLVGTNTVQHIFVTDDPAVPPIHTDPETQYQAVLSDIGPRMAVAVVAMILLYVWRLQEFAGLTHMPILPRVSFVCLFGLVVLMEAEMIWQYIRWKKRHEEAKVTGDWDPVISVWPVRLRMVGYLLTWGLLLGMVAPLVASMEVDWAAQNVWSVMWEVIGNPAVMMLVYLLCGWLATRVLWKKGYDEQSARTIGVLVGFVVLVLLLGLASEMEDYVSRKESGIADLENMAEIEEIPLTASELGLTPSQDEFCHRDEDKTSASLEYTVMLDTGGYLKYDYTCYREEEEAIELWEHLYKRYGRYVEEYTGEGTPYHYEWLEQELTTVEANRAAVVKNIPDEGSYILYYYIIQKGNVYWGINYLSESPLTEAQLQVIADQLP